ncbi:hypothetical protein THASP1DRAFT_1722, partial [Thamnocephalis sphaerospora]
YGIAGKVWDAAYFTALYLSAPSQAPEQPAQTQRPARSLAFMPAPNMLYPGLDATAETARSCRPLTVLELGSGTGYLGLHVARQLANWHRRQAQNTAAKAETPPAALVVLTDIDNTVPLLQRNVQLAAGSADTNMTEQTHAGNGDVTLDGQVRVWARPLHWGKAEDATRLQSELATALASWHTSKQNEPAAWDVVIGSDLVYFPELYPPLLETLCQTYTTARPTILTCGQVCSPRTVLVLGWRCRQMWRETPFWEQLGRHFVFEAVRVRTTTTKSDEQTHQQEEEEEDDEAFFGEDDATWVFVATRR